LAKKFPPLFFEPRQRFLNNVELLTVSILQSPAGDAQIETIGSVEDRPERRPYGLLTKKKKKNHGRHSPLLPPQPDSDLARGVRAFPASSSVIRVIHLGAQNRAMLVSRLWKILRALELNSFLAYYRRVKPIP